MAHILIVCTANICRSPVAAAMLEERLQNRGLNDWTVSSAGTWAQIKRGAARNSIRVMREYGLDISAHEARLIDKAQLQMADLVLCMESGHVEAIKIEFPGQARKIFLLSEMSGPAYNVHDPYGQAYRSFQEMSLELSRLIDNGLDKIIQLAEENSDRDKKATNLQ